MIYPFSSAQNRILNCHCPFIALCILLATATYAPAQDRGLVRNDSGAFEGYTLYAPLRGTETLFLNMQGEVVHKWTSKHHPSNCAYLMPNGDLIRAGKVLGNEVFGSRGPSGGRVERFNWEGEQLWDFVYSSDQHHQHHDIEPLPNGNVLILAWEKRTKEEAIAAGRKPDTISKNGIHPDTVVEVKQTGPTSGEIVWRWSAWDHLIQDHDSSKANYGDVAAHPEKIDINLNPRPRTDWMHTNAIDYNPELDQIVLSPRSFNELIVIDHSVATKEAAGSTGGKAGKGGDILYRWGNPANYRAGAPEDRTLHQQHDARWVQAGKPGAGNITIFNNGSNRPSGKYSSVDEITPPINANGSYQIASGRSFEPKQPHWSYTSPNTSDFYSSFISGAERLSNGNTLICDGPEGIFFEVTPDKQIVWQYNNPVTLPPAGPEGPNSVFRVTRYPKDYPGIMLK
ncbi:MAG: arylsulfotransferase (ASST) [Opitutales bacterium]|nr:arylsulfotransferase (ASST) [Opitutales bacterium]